jgi:hypothetical protein
LKLFIFILSSFCLLFYLWVTFSTSDCSRSNFSSSTNEINDYETEELVIQLPTITLPEGVLMTNIASAIARLREERREAQNQVQKLGEAITVLERLTRGGGATANAGSSARAKRILSAAGRRRISLAQKARWAKIRQTKKAA